MTTAQAVANIFTIELNKFEHNKFTWSVRMLSHMRDIEYYIAG